MRKIGIKRELISRDIDMMLDKHLLKDREEVLLQEAIASLSLPDKTVIESYKSLTHYYALILLYYISIEEYELAAKVKKIIEFEFEDTIKKIEIREKFSEIKEEELYNDILLIYKEMNNFILDEQEGLIGNDQ